MLRDAFYFGKKPNVHPKEKFASSLEDARRQATTNHFWIINEYCDYRGFDWDFEFEFLPDEDVWAEEHNNIWPSQHQKDSGTWLCPKERSDINIYRADVDPIRRKNEINECWHILDNIDKTKFDFSWHPDATDPLFIYKWGCKYYPVEVESCIEYHMPGATEIKFISTVVELLPDIELWQIVQEIDKDNFDFAWRPDPASPPFIYVWGNKWIPPEIEATLIYTVPGATEIKYMPHPISVLPDKNWKTFHKIDTKNFDMSWRPDPREPAFIYVWGNKWVSGELRPTLEYHTPGATEIKYIQDPVPLLPDYNLWEELVSVDKNKFDFTWMPDPREPAFIYVWGNQWNNCFIEPTLRYTVFGATEIKYMDDVAHVNSTQNDPHWETLLPISNFDFSWRPDLTEPPFIYVFGNKWNDSKTEPTLEYTVPGATVKKYMDYPVALPSSDMSLWIVNNKEDLETFDFSWRPNPYSQPQIYQWVNNGPRYTQPDATEVVLMEYEDTNRAGFVNRYIITTTLEDLIAAHADEVFWALNPDLTYDKFDFSWRPTNENFRHINTFGNEYSKNTQTYYINGPMYKLGHREMNYVADQSVAIETNLSMFYIDRGKGGDRYEALKLRYPQLQKTRYLNSWVETIQRCCNKSETKLFWVVNSELEYSGFMFDFYPSPWQMDMVHVFGTQWSHWGNTYLVNNETFEESTKYVKVIEHLNILNFVKDKRAIATDCLYDVVLVNHGNSNLAVIQTQIQVKINDKNISIVDYNQNYLQTFKDILNSLDEKREHYVWICSSICSYDNFDFSYVCDPFAKEQLHVFPSDKQKFGDTFLVDVNKLRSLINNMLMLEDYEKVNYNAHQRVNRIEPPVFDITEDTLCNSIMREFDFPYAVFRTEDIDVRDEEPISLWTQESKNILITSTGGTRIVVPKEAKLYVEGELYDYPYISSSKKLVKSKPLDIVFLSNGEIGADENYEHLLKVTAGLQNRVVRVDGVNGRVAAYHAAAEASETPWMFTVFAKLKVNSKFDWTWQPDRLQISKHYIFNAENPVNNLVYGHQAMIAYNKQITLANSGKGLDFTLDDEHEVVDMLSGVAVYNTDEWSAWRTSFREALKLKATIVENPNDSASVNRLLAWSTIGNGNYGDFSINGALDAIEYYDSVNGDLKKLRLSYDWPWLKDRFDKIYK